MNALEYLSAQLEPQMEDILISRQLTDALEKINSRREPGKQTIRFNLLADSEKAVISQCHKQLKQQLEQLSTQFKVAEFKLKAGMGMYQTSGNAFPHIWGAIIPEEVEKVSRKTLQLFVYRNFEHISWGICLSDFATDDEQFLKSFQESLKATKKDLEAVFAKGLLVMCCNIF